MGFALEYGQGRKVWNCAQSSPSAISLILSAHLRLKRFSLVIVSRQMDVTVAVLDTCPSWSGTMLVGAGAIKVHVCISTIKLGRWGEEHNPDVLKDPTNEPHQRVAFDAWL